MSRIWRCQNMAIRANTTKVFLIKKKIRPTLVLNYLSSRRKMTPFGASLRAMRVERGLSQTKFAEIIDIHPRVLSAVETGRRQPPSSQVIGRWAELAGLTSLELSRLEEAAQDSPYVIRLPKTASPRALRLVHRVVRAVESLKQEQLQAIQTVLEQGGGP